MTAAVSVYGHHHARYGGDASLYMPGPVSEHNPPLAGSATVMPVPRAAFEDSV